MVLKDRKQHRRLFICICNSFDEEFQLNYADKINKLNPIEEKAVLKTACEEKFQQLLLPANAPDAEIEKELDEKMQQIAVPKDEDPSRVERNTEIFSEVDQALSKLLLQMYRRFRYFAWIFFNNGLKWKEIKEFRHLQNS
ncbi:hypothetical protein TNCT_731131 [Trichonephila clavata]|uniref:Uncharacterized protein n=1 Tax=Trichonephila clavata TaxID=2740835 RepID=A0A8X6H7S4_TRICU|nr:hypothetical protein TNCT_731131 [Trichonephila clavata]